MRRNVGRITKQIAPVHIGFSILPNMAKNGTRTLSDEQNRIIQALKARIPNMFKRCRTTIHELGDERLYTSVQPLTKQLPNPSQLARVLEGNDLALRVDVCRIGKNAQSTHFRMTYSDIDNFLNGNPLQLSVLSDVVNNRNMHGKLLFERTNEGGFGCVHYEIGIEQDNNRFTYV